MGRNGFIDICAAAVVGGRAIERIEVERTHNSMFSLPVCHFDNLGPLSTVGYVFASALEKLGRSVARNVSLRSLSLMSCGIVETTREG